MAATIQIFRTAIETWDMYKVVRMPAAGADAWSYEKVARVVKSGDGLYHVELPIWNQNGFTWERQPRGYAMPEGAFAAATRPAPEPVKWKQ